MTDTDGAPGENVTFSATATDPEGEMLSYAWYGNDGETQLSTSPTPTIALPDGVSFIRLIVRDDSGEIGLL